MKSLKPAEISAGFNSLWKSGVKYDRIQKTQERGSSMRAYNTEIISVGTELLLGHITNTDARDISEMLSKIGINVKYHTVVGDNPERLLRCVQIAKERADIIITTGGLGPTCDDLTKQILANAFSLKLVQNEDEVRGLYDYIRNSSNFTPNNFLQAMLPEGCTVFHNLWGTAPGCAFEADGKTVLMMPGPPVESDVSRVWYSVSESIVGREDCFPFRPHFWHR